MRHAVNIDAVRTMPTRDGDVGSTIDARGVRPRWRRGSVSVNINAERASCADMARCPTASTCCSEKARRAVPPRPDVYSRWPGR